MKRAIEEETIECIWKAPFIIDLEMIKDEKLLDWVINQVAPIHTVKKIKCKEKYSEIVKKIEEDEKEFQRIFDMYIICD